MTADPKFKYLFVSIGGDEPTGTNSIEVAKAMAAQEDAWVIDVETGVIINSDGEPESDVEEADASDFLDTTDDADSGD